MRAALLIVAGNLVAFVLGGVIVLWLLQNAPAVATADPPAIAQAAGALSPPAQAAQSLSPVVSQAAASLAPAFSVPASSVPASSVPASSGLVSPTSAQSTPPPAKPVSAPATGVRGAWIVRLGAFLVPANARQMQALLAQHGFGSDLVDSVNHGKTWQLVQISGFPDRAAASQTSIEIERQVGLAGLVVRAAP